jgi:hypothetical protein
VARRYQTVGSPPTLADADGNPVPLEEQQRVVRKLNHCLGFKLPGRPRKCPGTTVAERLYLPLRADGRSLRAIAELTGRTEEAVKKAFQRLRPK